MDERFQGLGFYPADILLPRDCDLTKWAVVACDQYTSQPEYWQRVEFFVGNSTSALHLILPESSLEAVSYTHLDVYKRQEEHHRKILARLYDTHVGRMEPYPGSV